VSPTVALVTCAAHPDLSPDDRLLRGALAASGFRPVARSWDAAGEEWERYDAVVIRSCWDYHHRADEFVAWLDSLERRGARVFNPVPTMRWNARKTYLRDLSAAGVPVLPTAWVAQGEGTGLGEILRDRGWQVVVVKPTISATAFETWRVGPTLNLEDERRFAELVGRREVMIQPYLASIEDAGELSFIFLGGRFSHAVRKRPRPGDFRVQADFGGRVEPVRPSDHLIAQAASTLAAAPVACLYARVDACEVGGDLTLMELELIEPALFFREDPGACGRFIDALREALTD